MLNLPPVNISFRRRLTSREIATIGVALELLASAPVDDRLDSVRAELLGDESLLSDDAMRTLGFELRTALKVKVCRSKERPKP